MVTTCYFILPLFFLIVQCGFSISQSFLSVSLDAFFPNPFRSWVKIYSYFLIE